MTGTKEKARILIVEDETLIAADLESRLKALGYTVCGRATSAEPALKLIKQDPPELIMMDITLKGEMDGIEAAEVIRDKWKIPVVFLTAYADTDRLERAKLTYPFGYILKPFQDKDLKISLEMAIYAAKVDEERRKAEEALRESEELFRHAFENANDGVCLVDTNGNLLKVNGRMCDIFGYSKRELESMSVNDITHPDDKKISSDFLKSSVDGNLERAVFEKRYISKQKKILWGQISSSMVKNSQGESQYFISHVQDITDRKHAEETLRESERKFSALFHHMIDGFAYHEMITDNDGNPIDYIFLEVNSAFEHMTGLKGREIIGKRVTEVHPGIERSDFDWIKVYGKVALTGEPVRVEQYFPPQDNWYSISAYSPVRGYFACIVKNITESKRAEETSQGSRQRLNFALDAANVGIWEWDIETNEHTWSEQLWRLYGLAPRSCEPSHESWRMSIIPEDREKAEADVQEAARTVSELMTEWRVIAPDGDVRWLMSRGRPLRDSSGRTIRYLGVVIDITDRKRAEAVLLESENKFKSFSEQSLVGIYLIQDGIFQYVNPKFASIFGYTVDECLDDMSFRNLVFPEDLDKVEEQVRKQISGEADFVQGTFRGLKKNGEVIHAEIYGSSISYKGRPAAIGTMLDITEGKLAEKALRESEQRYRIITNALTDYIYTVHIENDQVIYTTHSPTCSVITGYTAEEFNADPYLWINIVVDDDREIVQQWAASILKGLAPGYIEHRIWRKDGEVRWVRNTPVLHKGPSGRLTAYDGLVQDITGQKRAEMALRESEEKFRSMMESLADLVYICSPDFTIEYMNPAMIERTGRDAVGEYCYNALHDFSKKCPWCIRERIDTGKPYFMEITSPKDNRLYQVSNSPIFNGDGTISKLSIFRDITQARRHEEEMKKLEAQLQQAQKMEAVGTLAGGIAHDFNNLLQAINGYAQILLFDRTEKDLDYHNLKAIQTSGERAAQLIRQLLLFSRKAKTEIIPVELNQVVETTKKILERTIQKMIHIEFHPGDRLWIVKADPVQIEQILLNLGSNAADVMPNGGKLIIKTENATLEEEYIREHLGTTQGNYVLLTFSDTGHGMDKETVEHIFEPFFTTKEVGKGTGLGLASVYGIVKSHGGSINCYSEVGQGTTFKIYLPAVEPTDAYTAEDLETKQPKGGTETILLVDDESSIRDFASQVLQRFGYTVLTASSGEEALEIYIRRPRKIDMVVMDIGMPGMGGYKCLREIIQYDSSARVLVASGYSINEQIKMTLEAGVAGYVVKPYQLTDLLNKVRAVLDEEA